MRHALVKACATFGSPHEPSGWNPEPQPIFLHRRQSLITGFHRDQELTVVPDRIGLTWADDDFLRFRHKDLGKVVTVRRAVALKTIKNFLVYSVESGNG